jgi:hypothetical protein
MKRTRQEKLGTDHAPPPPPEVCEAADRAFESWFKGLYLDDEVGATCAKVPKKTLRMVFMVGFANGGYEHWSTLNEPQVRALVRFYAPEATVRTPKDVSSSCAILEGLETEVRKKTTEDAMQGLKLARALGEAKRLIQGYAVPQEPQEPQATEHEWAPGDIRWVIKGTTGSDREKHGPGWEDHREAEGDV